jgi:hypothetical protein
MVKPEPYMTRKYRGVMKKISKHIQNKKKLSLIRLSDGESAFLGYPDYSGREPYEAFLLRWWGKTSLPEAEDRRLREDLKVAISKADILGIPNPKHPTREDMRNIHRMLTDWGLLRDRMVISSNLINLRFLENGYFEQIFQQETEIGMITPNVELKEIIEARYNVRIHLIGIRGQAKFFTDGPHYPDEYDKVLAAIQPKMLYIVSAGICGKVYCNRIRELGGIALDAGSITDFWAGKKTRLVHDRWKDRGLTSMTAKVQDLTGSDDRNEEEDDGDDTGS